MVSGHTCTRTNGNGQDNLLIEKGADAYEGQDGHRNAVT